MFVVYVLSHMGSGGSVGAQPWGWWTSHKLEILEDYLQKFVTASKTSDARIYLDLFAGWPENKDRLTDQEVLGSVHRALAVDPPFTHIGLFELEEKADRLDAALRARYPHRSEDFRVFAGDCNIRITAALRSLYQVRYAPTFAFIDQFAAEVHWTTFEHLARFKPRHLTKPELWLLFGTSFLPRGLRIGQEQIDAKFAERVTAMYGSEEWIDIIQARRSNLLSPADVRTELINLMRYRLEWVLGYKTTHTFTMKNTHGNDLYTMIFATDHDAGDRIMRSIYGKALGRHEQMRQDAHARQKYKRAEELNRADGVAGLFDISIDQVHAKPVADDRVYEHHPAWEPFRLPRTGH